MKKSYTQKIALLALMTALIIIFCFVPITFGTISLALMILPVLIVAQVEDFKTTFALSLYAIRPSLSPYTVNTLASVLGAVTSFAPT